jgi:hypothetical protein
MSYTDDIGVEYMFDTRIYYYDDRHKKHLLEVSGEVMA